MKRKFIFSAALSLLLVGCSEEAAQQPKDGEGLYNKSCLNCHGADLKGTAGPAVTNMSAKYSEEELLELINNGVGMMPGNLLSEEEAEIVTKWLMEK
jgi:cytochrome c551